jgi:hypothetical protein
MEDLVTPLDDDGVKGGGSGDDGGNGQAGNQMNILPPADLDDMDEFPPLHHAAT